MNTFTQGDRVKMKFVSSFVGMIIATDGNPSNPREATNLWVAVQWDGDDFYVFHPADTLELVNETVKQ